MYSAKNAIVITAFIFLLVGCRAKKSEIKNMPPNIVYILADDMGYGDVSVNYQESRMRTPNIDKLAKQGMRFTDAHSPSSVCTPTRYGILTGRYCWRSSLREGVLRGYGQALLEKERTTVAALLKDNGYTTGVVGKWHLGVNWVVKNEFIDSIHSNSAQTNAQGLILEMPGSWIDFTKQPTDEPTQHGFDYSYILPASLDMPPYCFLENGELQTIPDSYTQGNDLNTGYYGAFWRPGRIAPDFEFDQVLPTFTAKAKTFIARESKSEKPFFLYFPLAAPHTPWVPTEEYKNKSLAGQYGDFVQMVDETVGEIMRSLDEAGVAENTLVIFTSDNGPYWRPDKIAEFNHRAAGPYRGMKADIYDGGHRVPFIVRWPGQVEEESESHALITHTNLMATAAELVGVELDENTGEDSKSILPILLGQDYQEEPVIHHSSKSFFAIRKGDWKLVDRMGSGGFSLPVFAETSGGEPKGQLYNMREDPSETTNLYDERPDVVAELQLELDRIKRQ